MTCIVALINENKVLLGGDAAASDDKSGLIFQSDTADAPILKSSVTFKYSYYELEPDASSELGGDYGT